MIIISYCYWINIRKYNDNNNNNKKRTKEENRNMRYKSSTFRMKIQFIIYAPKISIFFLKGIHIIPYFGIPQNEPLSTMQWKYSYIDTALHTNTWVSRKIPMKFRKTTNSPILSLSKNPTNSLWYSPSKSLPTSPSYSPTTCTSNSPKCSPLNRGVYSLFIL